MGRFYVKSRLFKKIKRSEKGPRARELAIKMAHLPRTALIIIDNDLEAKLQPKSAAPRKQPSHDNTLFVESKPDPKRLSTGQRNWTGPTCGVIVDNVIGQGGPSIASETGPVNNRGVTLQTWPTENGGPMMTLDAVSTSVGSG